MNNIEKHNSARCFSYEELNSDLLKQFSEGSHSLEKLLNYCYNSKIVTRACCKGHSEFLQKPYILFLFTEEQKEIIENMLSVLLGFKNLISDNTIVELSMEGEIYKVSVNFYFEDVTLRETLKEIFFNYIQQTLSSYLDKGVYEPGIYEGITSLLESVNGNAAKAIRVIHSGMFIQKIKSVRLYYNEQGQIIEVPVSKIDDGTPDSIFIPTDQINDYLLDYRYQNDNGRDGN